MGYYKMLGVMFVILILSVLVQGEELFSDSFFAVAYAIMAVALFIGTKFNKSSRTANAIGLLLIFSVGFLSTQVLVDFFTKPHTITIFFKLMIVFSLDFCALFFLRYGRQFGKEEKESRLGQHEIAKELEEAE